MVTQLDSPEREWVQRWKDAAEALAQQRRRDLRNMSDSDALSAAENLLSLVGTPTLNPVRRVSSGLVQLQLLLHRRARA